MTDAPEPTAPTPAEQFRAAMNAFLRVRMDQMAADGVNPSATAVNLSMFGVQFEALVGLLITSGVIDRDQFQLACAAAAERMATALGDTVALAPQIQVVQKLN